MDEPTFFTGIRPDGSRVVHGEWQDIVTAPRDGSYILAWHRKSCRPIYVKWDAPIESKLDGYVWWDGQGSRWVNAALSNWMPLRPPSSENPSHE